MIFLISSFLFASEYKLSQAMPYRACVVVDLEYDKKTQECYVDYEVKKIKEKEYKCIYTIKCVNKNLQIWN